VLKLSVAVGKGAIYGSVVVPPPLAIQQEAILSSKETFFRTARSSAVVGRGEADPVLK
jgi:hypothetical protein